MKPNVKIQFAITRNHVCDNKNEIVKTNEIEVSSRIECVEISTNYEYIIFILDDKIFLTR